VNNLIIFSDSHFGDRKGLCPFPIRLDDGGWYTPSEEQEIIASYWKEFWDEWVPEATRGEPYDVLHNGDVIEGVHHGATHQISHNIIDQQRLALQVLGPIVERCKSLGGQYYQIRGTPAHVGESAVYEEQLAQQLGAVPNSVGQYARYRLRKRVGKALVHCMHHIGTTSSSAYESSAVNSELIAEFVEAARWNREAPDYVVRSHRHRSIAVEINTARGYAAGIVTPGWQGKTPFAWKVAGARITLPQFGGLIIRQGDVEFYFRRRVWSIEEDQIEE
jgi:hypothetical protein